MIEERLPVRRVVSFILIVAFLALQPVQALVVAQSIRPPTSTIPTLPDQPVSPRYSGCGGDIAPTMNADYEQRAVELVNAERFSLGLPPLKHVAELDVAARYHAADLGMDDYFDHATYDRSGDKLMLVCGWSTRIRVYYPSPNAENIAAGFSSPENVMNAWMKSAGHRDNILTTNSREIGVGYYQGNGQYNRYWVMDFGKRQGVYPLVINGDAAQTTSPYVTIYIYGSWDDMRLRNENGAWTPWQPFQNTFPWLLSNLAGTRTVKAEMRDSLNSAAAEDSIVLILALDLPFDLYLPFVSR